MTTVDLRRFAGRYTDSGKRCGKCGKKTLVDAGPGPFGDDGSLEFCLDCADLTPESSWAAFDPGRAL